MHYQQINKDSGVLVVIYPDHQRNDINPILQPLPFKHEQDLIGTNVTVTVPIWQNYKTTKLIDFKVPQKVQEIETVDRTLETDQEFLKFIEPYKEQIGDLNIVKLVKLYCIFDEAIANTPKEQLIVEERTAHNYLDDSEKLAS